MKAYPSIVTAIDRAHTYHVFDKLDGSNLRAEWSPQRNFYKFGTRTQLLSGTQEVLFPAIEKFQAKYAEELGARFRRQGFQRVVAFFEYAGPRSFAGSHHDSVEAMDVVLFDLDVYKKGLLPPERFLDLAQGLDTPRLLYRGRIDDDFVESVRLNTLPGITAEGVVGKGPFLQKEGGPIQFKIKTLAWLDKLRHYCGPDEALFRQLS